MTLLSRLRAINFGFEFAKLIAHLRKCVSSSHPKAAYNTFLNGKEPFLASIGIRWWKGNTSRSSITPFAFDGYHQTVAWSSKDPRLLRLFRPRSDVFLSLLALRFTQRIFVDQKTVRIYDSTLAEIEYQYLWPRMWCERMHKVFQYTRSLAFF